RPSALLVEIVELQTPNGQQVQPSLLPTGRLCPRTLPRRFMDVVRVRPPLRTRCSLSSQSHGYPAAQTTLTAPQASTHFCFAGGGSDCRYEPLLPAPDWDPRSESDSPGGLDHTLFEARHSRLVQLRVRTVGMGASGN